MKTTRKAKHSDVIKWVNESRLDLPDQWVSIQQNLKLELPDKNKEPNDQPSYQNPKLFRGRRLLLASIGLAIVILLSSVFILHLLDQRLLLIKKTGDSYQQMALYSLPSVSSISTISDQTQSTVSDNSTLLAFQNRVDEQTELMDENNITEKYAFYAGRFIEDQNTFVVYVTCEPEEFIETYADILDFNFIQVRQVKYTYTELASADEQINNEWIKSDRLIKMGMIGHGVDEKNNAVLIVVQNLSDEIRSEISKIVSDTDMIEFEIGGEIIPY